MFVIAKKWKILQIFRKVLLVFHVLANSLMLCDYVSCILHFNHIAAKLKRYFLVSDKEIFTVNRPGIRRRAQAAVASPVTTILRYLQQLVGDAR